ncbi:hypothetical protein PVK06_035978 [Gossypium arboreum]|uniref:Uncharacterized protein n=1 Tax=Gossypium arboreum TaxID=29729 RepID=A0ABR0NJD7_GOSAR|nr:hypothetical protein PVK06_035978 [Gossypium arboreum]
MGPHTLVACPCGPTYPDWPNLCVHTATLTPPHGRVLRMAMPSLITRPCLAHDQPYGQAHANVTLTKITNQHITRNNALDFPDDTYRLKRDLGYSNATSPLTTFS